MECLAQYLDDFEDLLYAIALKAERIRMAVIFFFCMSVSAALQIVGVLVALRYPPIALAMASLLSVGMLYNAAVGYSPSSYAN